jgi:hypothetical protein
MPDRILPRDYNFWSWLSETGEIGRNVLRGNVGAAGRHLGNFLVQPLDALLPGDAIPDITRPEDQYSTGEMIKDVTGMDTEEAPWYVKYPLEIGAGAITDPLTYVPGGVIASAAKAPITGVKAGARATEAVIPGMAKVNEAIGSASNAVRDALNWSKIHHNKAGNLGKGRALEATSKKAAEARIKDIAARSGVAPNTPEAEAIFDAFQNIRRDPNDSRLVAGRLLDNADEWRDAAGTKAAIADRLAQHPTFQALDEAGKNRVLSAASDMADMSMAQWSEGMGGSVFNRPDLYRSGSKVYDVGDLMPQYEKDMAEFTARAKQNAANARAIQGGGPLGIIQPEKPTFDQWAAGQKFEKVANPEAYSKRTYLHRYMDEDAMADAGIAGTKPSSNLKSAMTDEELHTFLNPASPGYDPTAVAKYLESMGNDPYTALTKASEQHARNMMRASVAKGELGGAFKSLVDPKSREAIDQAIKDLVNSKEGRDYGVQLEAIMHGQGKLDPISGLASGANKIFKKAATTGLGIPRPAFYARNIAGSIQQIMTSPEGRRAFIKDPLGAIKNLANTADVGIQEYAKTLGIKKGPVVGFIKDQTSKDLAAIDEAVKASDGTATGVMNTLRANGKESAAELVEHGIIDGQTNLDDMLIGLSKPADTGVKAKLIEAIDTPARINQHVEARMRAGHYLAARQAGMQPAEAAARVKADLLDYTAPTLANRRFRAWVPFGAFTSQTIPQTAKWLTEGMDYSKPFSSAIEQATLGGGAARNTMTELFASDPNAPVYQSMQGQANIDLGLGEDGKTRNYLTSLGLPFEAAAPWLNPTWENLRKAGIGSLQPLVKTGISQTMGIDPYFGTPAGSYTDLPLWLSQTTGMDRSGSPELGKTLSLLQSTGLLQPINTPLNMLSTVVDPRKSTGEKAASLLTGAKITPVDEQRALQQAYESALTKMPQVKTYTSIYSKDASPDVQDLLSEYHRVQKDIRDKRKAEQIKNQQPL